ncbi:hypothetical protein [Brevundimonas naejangsanensis]|uniref:hypothetical protein n=1 Tax=Brevundimonas naejangsanensis TaxID=588932 RepID=UPI00320AF3E2
MVASHEARLSAMPDLLQRLLGQPLLPLTKARLPDTEALYLFYHDEEPILVGSPPHIDEVRTLSPSVRLAQTVSTGGLGLADVSTRDHAPPPMAARWLRLNDEEDRVMLELYTAQALGLSVSHPRIRAGLAG